MGGLSKLMDLNRRERRLVARAATRLVVTETMLRVMGFTRYRKLVDRRRPTLLDEKADADELVETVVLAVRRASRGLRVGQCLGRSFASYQMLRARGVDVKLHIGFFTAARGFEAHAWLEHRGEVVGESLDQRLVPFPNAILGVDN